MDKIVGPVLVVIVSTGFVGLGVYILRHLDAATAFFYNRGASLYGRGVARRVYKRANIRIGALGFTVGGSVFVMVGLIRLSIYLVALAAS